MKITPFGNNILVKPIEKKQILVADKNSLCEYGEIIEVGSQVVYLKKGQIIGYTVWGINSLDIENERCYFIPETSEFILGTIEM